MDIYIYTYGYIYIHTDIYIYIDRGKKPLSATMTWQALDRPDGL